MSTTEETTSEDQAVEMRVASKSRLFEVALPTRDVMIPELGPGDFIRVRALSGSERDAYEASLYEERKNKRKLNIQDATARLVVMSCINEDGSRYFGDDEVGKLSRKVGAKILTRLADAARELSGITEEEQAELVKN